MGPRRRNAAAIPLGRIRTHRALANLGGDALRPAPVGAYPAGASAYGVEQMLGDVWEWTSSPMRPWPGFTPMIYEQYSQPFFDGDYRVLRGGSWAVASGILRPSFRNWDHPIRRQIFSGSATCLGCRLMCRHLGWLGEPVSVASLVLEPAYGLLVQSYAPRRQKHGLMNADGWGVGFFDERCRRAGGAAPPRYGVMPRSNRSRPHCAAAALSRRCGRLPSACRSKPARPRRSPMGNGCFLTTASSTVPCCLASRQAESTCDSALLAALIFARGLDALGETIAEVGRRRPQCPAEHLGGQRISTAGDHVG